MGTRIFLGVKDGRCVRVTTLPPSCAFWSLNLPETPKATRPVVGLLYLYYMEQKKKLNVEIIQINIQIITSLYLILAAIDEINP